MKNLIGRTDLLFELYQSVTLLKDLDLHIAHNILSHCILPCKGTLDQFSTFEARLLWGLMHNHPINLPHLIAQHIHTIISHSFSLLPYGRLLTFLFTNFNIALSDEVSEPSTRFMTINEATIKRMGYKFQNNVWVYQGKGPIIQAPARVSSLVPFTLGS